MKIQPSNVITFTVNTEVSTTIGHNAKFLWQIVAIICHRPLITPVKTEVGY